MNNEEIIKNDSVYLKGNKNFFIRCYFYLEQGLNILNIFRNLILGIIGLCLTLKLTDYRYMVFLFVVSVPVLTVMGWVSVHKIAKTKEWLNTRFSTHYALEQFNYTKRTAETLEEINNKIK